MSPKEATREGVRKLIEPTRIGMYGPDATELTEWQYRPFFEPMQLMLYFKVPENLHHRGKCNLVYHSDRGDQLVKEIDYR